ncbi:hypothetical protein ACHHYP_05910 [Achlya hypogyna]|uniref:Uncharacterized protein n=1 Tax=Achlya hypogyna TaxID=1202772 RepID=A0A1V9YWL7_ACHHY|nr:hypothetical protein ACHHYP_05910 [Achlya hypogyna]
MEAALATELEGCVVDKGVLRKLLYQWHAAHAALLRLPSAAKEDALLISHTLATAFVSTLRGLQTSKDRQLSRPLPSALVDSFCEKCDALLVPGVSASVRVVHQKHNAPINAKRARSHAAAQRKAKALTHRAAPALVRVRNAVVTTCHRCQHARTRAGAAVASRRPKKRKAPTAEPVAAPVTLAALTAKPAAPSPPRKLLDGPKKKKKKAAPAPASALDSFLKTLRPNS